MTDESAKHKILIVDDDPINRNVLTKALEEEYIVFSSEDGKGGLEIAESENKPDLILLDVVMKGMDGFQVCRELKSKEKTKNIPVIFLTAKSEKKDVVKGFAAGGIDYITKPFDLSELHARVKAHIRLKSY